MWKWNGIAKKRRFSDLWAKETRKLCEVRKYKGRKK